MLVVRDDEKRDIGVDTQANVKKLGRRQVFLGSGSLALAAIEAVCLFFVAANGSSLLLGGAAVALARGAVFIHQPIIRLPLMGVAALGAGLNLWLVVNAWKLRNASSARWRKKPLSSNERLRVVFVVTISMLTLLLIFIEIFLHHRLHGSAFA